MEGAEVPVQEAVSSESRESQSSSEHVREAEEHEQRMQEEEEGKPTQLAHIGGAGEYGAMKQDVQTATHAARF